MEIKKSLLFFFLFTIFLGKVAISQCNLIVPVHTFKVCRGNPVQLNSFLDCTEILDSNNFNSGILGPGWNSSSGPLFTNPCGSGSDGSPYLWIGPASTFPREIVSPSFTITDSCMICFDMMYASQANGTPCEGPDESTEGVHLQYSSVGPAGPWNEINYWDPVGGYDPLLTTWNNHCETLYYNGDVWFRWYQTNTSGNDYDHWGLDNIYISAQSPVTSDSVYWSNQNDVFYYGTTPPAFIPDSSIWVTVTHDNGNNIYIDSIRIEVFQNDTVTFSGITDTLCNSDPSFPLLGHPSGGYFSGNGIIDTIFNPSLANIGWNLITYNYELISTDSISGELTVFFDNFSSDKGWTGYGYGGWSRGSAIASTGCSGNQDPSTDHTPTTDNFIIGNYLGSCYQNSLTSTYWLTSPIINCSGFNSCKVQFYSFSGCESPTWDHMYIDVSSNSGTSWSNIYSNIASVSEPSWTLRSYQTPEADNSPDFKIRIGLGVTDGSVTYSGWNIDDFSIICDGQGVQTDTLCVSTYTDSIYVENCTNIEATEINQQYLKIMPNPASGNSINVEWQLSKEDHPARIEIYNSKGQKVYNTVLKENTGYKEIFIEKLNNGLYELRLLNSNSTFARKIMVVNRY